MLCSVCVACHDLHLSAYVCVVLCCVMRDAVLCWRSVLCCIAWWCIVVDCGGLHVVVQYVGG